MTQLGSPTLDPAFVIGWHVGKAAAVSRCHASMVPGGSDRPDRQWQLNLP